MALEDALRVDLGRMSGVPCFPPQRSCYAPLAPGFTLGNEDVTRHAVERVNRAWPPFGNAEAVACSGDVQTACASLSRVGGAQHART